MTQTERRKTAAQEILLAADDLTNSGCTEFSEWDLTVATWKRDQNRFGCRGYEDKFPDHKRVMMEIMGQTKRDNPIRRGFIEKVRTNFYRITPLGQAEASTLRDDRGHREGTTRSAGRVFTALEGPVSHRSFLAWKKDPDEPRSWLGAAAFLGLTKGDANDLNDRIRAVETAIRQGIEWCNSAGRDELTRGPQGGSRPITRADLEQLSEFIAQLEQRFARQMAAIRKKDN